MSRNSVRLFLSGDVMTGRGIDQIQSHPSNPVLYESAIRDARAYVRLAERVHGTIERPVDPTYIWGDLLGVLEEANVDARIINLETSITTNEDQWPGKGIHYRMHPRNVACLTAARIECCCLANNHVLDWGFGGLEETLRTLDDAGLKHAGAGRNGVEAAAPAVIEAADRGRLLVFSYGAESSGIPTAWRAGEDRPGLNVLNDLSEGAAQDAAVHVRQTKRPGDVTVVSIHWGGNWGYDVPDEHVRFARRLIDGGVDIVHGHSSHHPRALEVYRDRLILYGCGDLLNDYEGISGKERYRGDLSLAYLIEIEPRSGRLLKARMVPHQIRGFQLHRASARDAEWLRALLTRLGASFETNARLEDDGSLTLEW